MLSYTVVAILLVIVFAVAFYVGVKSVKVPATPSDDVKLKTIVESVCTMIEMIITTPGSGPEKFKKAVDIIRGECQAQDVEFNIDAVTEIIYELVDLWNENKATKDA